MAQIKKCDARKSVWLLKFAGLGILWSRNSFNSLLRTIECANRSLLENDESMFIIPYKFLQNNRGHFTCTLRKPTYAMKNEIT